MTLYNGCMGIEAQLDELYKSLKEYEKESLNESSESNEETSPLQNSLLYKIINESNETDSTIPPVGPPPDCVANLAGMKNKFEQLHSLILHVVDENQELNQWKEENENEHEQLHIIIENDKTVFKCPVDCITRPCGKLCGIWIRREQIRCRFGRTGIAIQNAENLCHRQLVCCAHATVTVSYNKSVLHCPKYCIFIVRTRDNIGKLIADNRCWRAHCAPDDG